MPIRLPVGDGSTNYLKQALLEAQAAYGAELELDGWERSGEEWIGYVSPMPFKGR